MQRGIQLSFVPVKPRDFGAQESKPVALIRGKTAGRDEFGVLGPNLRFGTVKLQPEGAEGIADYERRLFRNPWRHDHRDIVQVREHLRYAVCHA